jgi:hypothetical protein
MRQAISPRELENARIQRWTAKFEDLEMRPRAPKDVKWYAAHLVMFVQFKKHRQSRYPIWENIILIKARSDEEALDKAGKRGRRDEGDSSGTFRWCGKPTRWVFAGVRQIVYCDGKPVDGTEISFLELEVGSKKTLEKILEGKTASARIAAIRRPG